jgi:hypothetical protein
MLLTRQAALVMVPPLFYPYLQKWKQPWLCGRTVREAGAEVLPGAGQRGNGD